MSMPDYPQLWDLIRRRLAEVPTRCPLRDRRKPGLGVREEMTDTVVSWRVALKLRHMSRSCQLFLAKSFALHFE